LSLRAKLSSSKSLSTASQRGLPRAFSTKRDTARGLMFTQILQVSQYSVYMCVSTTPHISGELTKLGRRMAEFPLDPQLAKTLLASETYGVSDQVSGLDKKLDGKSQ